MNVVIVFRQGHEWIPAHPGYMSHPAEIEQVIRQLQHDGYITGLVLAEKWGEYLEEYRLGGELNGPRP